MPIWQDAQGDFYDDDNGKALTLPTWPQSLTLYTATYPPVPTAAQIHQQLQAQAQAALDRTDLMAFRCFKAGIAFPAAWQTYTIALRNIVNGTDATSTALPTQPAYPAGT